MFKNVVAGKRVIDDESGKVGQIRDALNPKQISQPKSDGQENSTETKSDGQENSTETKSDGQENSSETKSDGQDSSDESSDDDEPVQSAKTKT